MELNAGEMMEIEMFHILIIAIIMNSSAHTLPKLTSTTYDSFFAKIICHSLVKIVHLMCHESGDVTTKVLGYIAVFSPSKTDHRTEMRYKVDLYP